MSELIGRVQRTPNNASVKAASSDDPAALPPRASSPFSIASLAKRFERSKPRKPATAKAPSPAKQS